MHFEHGIIRPNSWLRRRRRRSPKSKHPNIISSLVKMSDDLMMFEVWNVNGRAPKAAPKCTNLSILVKIPNINNFFGFAKVMPDQVIFEGNAGISFLCYRDELRNRWNAKLTQLAFLVLEQYATVDAMHRLISLQRFKKNKINSI